MSKGYLPPLRDMTEDVVSFLARNGWLDEPPGIDLPEDDPLLKRACMNWQEFVGIRPDGWFGPVSESRASEKCCGLPDLNHGFVWEDGEWREWSMPACTQRWVIDEVTVTHENMSFSSLSREATDRAWWKAWQEWMAIPAKLPRVKRVPWNGPGSANAWHRARYIDGGSNVLAWQVLPGCSAGTSRTCEGRYDTGERWAEDFFSGVCCHEQGHFWGFGHSSSSADLMYPYARRNILTPQSGDIKRVQNVYGISDPGEPPKPNPPTDLETRVSNLETQVMINRAAIEILGKGL